MRVEQPNGDELPGCACRRGNAWPARALRDRSGASAVEFALVVPVLLTLVFGFMQFAFILYADSALRMITQQVARELRVRGTWIGMTSDFEQYLCRGFNTVLLDCRNLKYRVMWREEGLQGMEEILGRSAPQGQEYSGSDMVGSGMTVDIVYRPPFLVPFITDAIIRRSELRSQAFFRVER